MQEDFIEQNGKNENEDEEEQLADRPLECSECKKDISVLYTEIVGESITRTCMCKECPELQRRLYGSSLSHKYNSNFDNLTSLACGNCGTTFNSIHVGAALGCSDCYEVFNIVLLDELSSAKKISTKPPLHKRTTPIHIGRGPNENLAMSPSLRLLALNEALNETIKTENYEQAAKLRDQIKALTENPEKPNDGK